MDILEENKKIARFMGYTYFGHNDPLLKGPPGWKTQSDTGHAYKGISKNGKYLCRSHHQLRYHWDWNLLIPVCINLGLEIPTDIKKCYEKVIEMINF